MSILVSCSCGAKLKAPDTAAGKTVACPKCKARLTVPAPIPAAPVPVITETPSTHKTSTLAPTLLLRFTRLRQATRQAYDLSGLGPATVGRLIAALILGGVFLLGILFASLLLLHLDTMNGFLMALLAFAAIVIPSAILIAWSPDAALEETHNRALAELRARHAARKELEAKRAAAYMEPESLPQRSPKPATTQECPYCAAEIPLRAVTCKYCGEFVEEVSRPNAASAGSASANVHVNVHSKERKWNPGIAAVLSFFIPGLGQIYKGQVINGLVWLIVTSAGYACFVFPGIAIQLFCIIGAASGDPYR